MNQSISEGQKTIGRLAVGALALIFIVLVISFSSISNASAGLLSIAVCLLVLFIMIPQIGVYLTLIALPLINWNFYIKGLIIPAVDVIAALSLGAFALRALYDKLFTRGYSLRLPYFKYFIFFLLAALVSALFADRVWESLWYAVRWIAFMYAAYVVVPVNVIVNKERLRIAIVCLVVAAVGVALMGVTSLFFQDWQNNFVRVQPTEMFGIYPIGENQNLIAEFLVIAAFFVVSLLYWRGSAFRSKLIKISALFFVLVAIGTFSRAAWISLFVASVLYFFNQSLEVRRRYIMPLLMIGLVLAPFSLYMVKLQNEFTIGVSSTENRLLMSQIAADAWRSSPVFGQGSGTFIGLIDENIRFRAQYGDPLDSHGVWQKILAENGLFGIISFALFTLALFYGLRQAFKRIKGTKEVRLYLPLALGALSGFLFQFFNTSYYKGKVWLPIGLALAATYLLERSKSKKDDAA